MTFEETRDNTTAIAANQSEADSHEEVREGIRRSKPFMDDYLPEQEEPEDPEHDPIGDADTDYDIKFDADDADENHPMGGDNDAWHGGDDDEPEEDDGQPSEYEEWQDYFGGDEHYDHSENEMW